MRADWVLWRYWPPHSNEVRLKALETDTARVVSSGYRTRPPSGAGAFLPLEEATDELIDEMTAGILEQWRRDVFQAGRYPLEVSDISFDGLSLLNDERAVGRSRGLDEGLAVRDNAVFV